MIKDIEKTLWAAADKLRNNMDTAPTPLSCTKGTTKGSVKGFHTYLKRIKHWKLAKPLTGSSKVLTLQLSGEGAKVAQTQIKLYFNLNH